jgi:Ca2+-binding RTX toxin-like protein
MSTSTLSSFGVLTVTAESTGSVIAVGVTADGKSVQVTTADSKGLVNKLFPRNKVLLTVLNGGKGDDTLLVDESHGAYGATMMFGNEGNDILIGGSSLNLLFGGAGNDVLCGGKCADLLSGDGGDDVLIAGSGLNVVAGGSGANVMIGSTGRTLFFSSSDKDVIDSSIHDRIIVARKSVGMNS